MKNIILICILGAALLYQVSAVNDVIVKNLKLYVNCQEFIIKAFCYAPTPLGATNANANNMGGLCSSRTNAFGTVESACQDEDFFDGSIGDPARSPPGPANGWFEALWERDFPLMVEAGANTVRIYHASPYTLNYTAENVGTNGIVGPFGKSHRKFLDMANDFGLKVIFPLPGEQAMLATLTQDQMNQLIRNVIDEVGDHPALLMWSFGNELPLDDTMVALLNTYIGYSRQYTLQKWNRFIPITHAVVDLPTSYDRLAATLDVDVFSTNAGYRGYGFSDLWDGNPGLGFSGWRALSQTYNKPLFISEVGWMSLNNQITIDVPNWFNQIYSAFIPHIADGCVGVAFFEFNDEAIKADPLQQTMGAVAMSPATLPDGTSSVDANVWVPDVATRKTVFNQIKAGTYLDMPYNFGADLFTVFLNRSADMLSSAECVPTATTGPRTSWGTTTTTTGDSQSTTGGTVTSATSSASTTGSSVTSSVTASSSGTVVDSTTADNIARESSASVISSSVFAALLAIFYFLF